MHVVDKLVYGMASIRFISSAIECLGGFLMLYFGTTQKALQVNGLLALVGPVVLISVTALGVTGMAGEVSLRKLVVLMIGVGCILYGTR